MQIKQHEIWVGIFMLIAFCSFLFLLLQVANSHALIDEPTYRIYAIFDNIGSLKKRSPVKIGGVIIGRVSDIQLTPQTYLPRVAIDVYKQYNQIPDTSSLAISTPGLLGEQFLSLSIGFKDYEMGTSILKDGSTIQNTKSAIMLEDLIGYFVYNTAHYNFNKKNNFSSEDYILSKISVLY
ncbi:outer membrane lipid asymmetry maintenance protein MlaD [Candidatus Profftia tarda]|uniref:Probable phospholipid ABC transporter-binding protein MlaD n=1 Tax=Candidatus Profftia tarda TaxID=1177216 RepID=A0A8E4EY89_9ENTR|nr:outer membrane lipid asymmetry maintenance protein MlaD [Candidatus Profftia tarda]CAD6509686.1 Probable phospholipid ABC transporter-binding protein MlaD [Candidatus Profftia tarda]